MNGELAQVAVTVYCDLAGTAPHDACVSCVYHGLHVETNTPLHCRPPEEHSIDDEGDAVVVRAEGFTVRGGRAVGSSEGRDEFGGGTVLSKVENEVAVDEPQVPDSPDSSPFIEVQTDEEVVETFRRVATETFELLVKYNRKIGDLPTPDDLGLSTDEGIEIMYEGIDRAVEDVTSDLDLTEVERGEVERGAQIMKALIGGGGLGEGS